VNADIFVPSDFQCRILGAGAVAGDILVDGKVNGNLKHSSGELVLRGILDGNIETSTDGAIVIMGTVDGNIQSTGNGKVGIRRGARVKGNIKMLGGGELTLDVGSIIGGNVEMEGVRRG